MCAANRRGALAGGTALTYSETVQFVETSIFTQQIEELLDHDAYRALQQELASEPGGVGDLISGSGGLRKVRWRSSHKGKRGGIRVIYYWHPLERSVYMLVAYAKSEREDLTKAQLKFLRQLVLQEFT